LVENRDFGKSSLVFKDVGITRTIAAPYCTALTIAEHRQQRRLWRSGVGLHF
jgi:hypothetical protein